MCLLYNKDVATKKVQEVEILGIRKGTKLTDTPKSKMLRIRIDEETNRKLQAVCKAEGKSMSEIVRAGIERQYAEMKK